MDRLRNLLSIVGMQGARGMSIALCVGAFVPVIYPGLGAVLLNGYRSPHCPTAMLAVALP